MKRIISFIYLLAIVFTSFLQKQGITITIATFYLAISFILGFPLRKKSFYILWLGIIIFTGTITGLNNDSYNIYKDIFYFSVPVIFFLCGSTLSNIISLKHFLHINVLCGLCISCIVIYISLSNDGFKAILNPYESRYSYGIIGSPAPVLSLAILFYSRKYHYRLFSKVFTTFLIVINFFGFYMMASRTYYFVFILFIIFLILNRIKKYYIIRFSILAFLILIVFNYSKNEQIDNYNQFTTKIFSSFSEISINKFDNEEDITNKYRGYESYRALVAYKNGNTVDWIFGGFGKLVDLDSYVLGDTMRYIPILHNGWLYILLKGGIFGLIIYALIFFSIIIKNWRIYFKKTEDTKLIISSLSLGITFSLIITNYVVYSIINPEMAILLISLGFFHSHPLSFSLESKSNMPIIKRLEV